MKTVASTLVLLLAALSFVTPSDAAPKMPAAELIDMYALREADSVVIHILANGDISQFLSDRAKGEKSYKLTLDVPALSPIDAKYDVETPFSHGFQMWPMQLEKKYYSRIEIELDLAASSVVGLLNESHLFIRINHESLQQAPVALSAPANAFDEDSDRLPPPIQASPGVAVTPLGVLPIEPGSSDEDGGVAEEPPSEPEFVLARSAPERGEEVSGSAVDENGVSTTRSCSSISSRHRPQNVRRCSTSRRRTCLSRRAFGVSVSDDSRSCRPSMRAGCAARISCSRATGRSRRTPISFGDASLRTC